MKLLSLLQAFTSRQYIIVSALINYCRGQSSDGWQMSDRFSGFRFEIHFFKNKVDTITLKNTIRAKADNLSCFGWVQDSPNNTLVGEARCNKNMGFKMKRFLRGEDPDDQTMYGYQFGDFHTVIKVYEDTKIKLHFSHFKILDSRRETCFRDEPHKCEDDTIDLL